MMSQSSRFNMGKLGRFTSFPGKDLKILKIITIISPALFIALLELLRYTIFGNTGPTIWAILTLIFIVTVAAYFFSRHIFTTIDRVQNENRLRVRELAALSKINQTVIEFNTLSGLLNRVMGKLIQITGADYGELYLVEEPTRELLLILESGVPGDAFTHEMKLRLKEILMSEGTRLGQPVIEESLKSARNRLFVFLADARVRSFATIPLKSRSGVIGVACLFSRKPGLFKLNQLNMLQTIGNPIASAIENARLYENVQAKAVLEERERISTELHDGLAQVLSYVITKSQATRQLLKKMTEANDYLVELENVAQEIYTDTREAILGLRTAISGDRSMVSALREYAVWFNQMHNIKTELTVGDRIIPALPPQTELQVIRIIQEALSNVRKHAEATRATINITAGDDNVTIMVEDDGKGFDAKKARKDWDKFGLRNMKERANSIRGNLLIESSPDAGTKVILVLPLTSSQAMAKEGEEIESTGS
jgi:signal transduction histidine kinase